MQPTLLPAHRDNTWWIDSVILLAMLAILYFIFLGDRPLFIPDEGRYAEIAREMASAGDYITPHLNGVKYFEKPALFYWLGAASLKLAGINLWSIRSINALLGVLGCLITYITTRKLYGRTTGLLAAFILGTSTLYFVMSHMVSLDLPVTVFLSACLYAFLLGIQQPMGNCRRYYLWTAAACSALAILTKGLIGLIFPAMIVSAWIALMGEWRLLTRLYLPSCLLILLVIAAPWHILVGQRNPEFYYFYFIQQHFLRYTSMDIGHYQPAWYFIPTLILGFFPWVAFLPQTIAANLPTSWKQRVNAKTELFFLVWAILIFAFFSFSKSKLIPYILPVLPPLAILTARYLVLSWQQKTQYGIKAAYAFIFLFSLAFPVIIYEFIKNTPLTDTGMAAFYLYITAGILILGTVISATLISFHRTRTAIIITICTSAAFLVTLLMSMPFVDTRTTLPLAKILQPILQADDEVMTYNQYYQDLPFYLQRRITIVNWRNELRQGMNYQDTSDWLIGNQVFWERWNSNKRVYVVMSMNQYEDLLTVAPKNSIHLLGQTTYNVLISNKTY